MENTIAEPSSGRDGNTRELGLEAYRLLKEAIEDGTILPGARLTELDLSGRFKMSRTPIREALYRLESEGLLVHVPRRGLVVTEPDHQMIVELFTMREALEGTAAKLAAQHASEPELSMLVEINQQEPSMFSDARGLARLNRRFHTLIWMSAHNRFLLKSLDNMASTVALLPNVLNMDELVEKTHQEHRAIVEAIVRRDAVNAEEAARAHIRSTGRRRLELMSQSQD